MSVTKFFIALAAVGLLLTLAAWPINLHFYIFVFWNTLLIGLLSMDFLLTPSPHIWNIRRDKEDRLYFKSDNEVTFYVRNTSRYPLWVQTRDEIGRHFTVSKESLPRQVQPRIEQAFSYNLFPAKRGSFQFENIYLRYYGLVGLCIKYATVPCPIDFKVYPNVRDLSKYRLILQKNRLLPQGEKTIRHYGSGTEFESLRSYVIGDDYRKINWQATARENRLMVNQYQIERNQPVYILLDTGRPMSYSVNGYKKLDYAINAALILCDIVNQQGDNAGLLVFDSTVRTHINPGKGAAHRNQFMDALYHVEDNRLTANYEGAFQALCERQKRRSLVFIFTDFEILEEAEDLIAHIALLKRRHMPIVVFMANEGLNALAEQPIYGKKDQVLRDTAKEFLAERSHIFRSLNAMRIPNVESTAENFAVAAVNRYIQLSKV